MLITDTPPVGFWIEDGRGKWFGPFASEKEAAEIGISLSPDRTESLKIVVLGEFRLPDVVVKITKRR